MAQKGPYCPIAFSTSHPVADSYKRSESMAAFAGMFSRQSL